MLLKILAVDCGPLSNPTNGWVHIAPNTLFGGQALYRCKLGYQLSSNVIRICQANGHWSGSAPTCHRKIFCYSIFLQIHHVFYYSN